jgi:phage-related protein
MLSDIFASIRTWWLQLALRFSQIATWLLNQGVPWSYLSPPFQTIRDICQTIAGYFYSAYSVALTIETQLADAWSKAKQVFAYAYDVLAVKVNDALNLADTAWDKAVTAYTKAVNAWDYAKGWLTDRANEAWSRAGAVWGTVTNYLKDLATSAYNKAVWAYEQIAAAVTTKAQEIYAWVKGIPAEIKDYIDGVVAAIDAVTTAIVQTLINTALATLAAPINLINLWFDAIQNFFNDPLGWLLDKFGDWFFGPEK